MTPSRSRSMVAGGLFVAVACSMSLIGACKRSEPPPDLLKTQHDAMERAKAVGNTMQKSVDAEGRKADEEGK